jgi:hypothetical protein
MAQAGVGGVLGVGGIGSATGTASGLPVSSSNPAVSTPISTDTNPSALGPTATGTYSQKFKPTQGWYMALGVVVAILVGNTAVGPFALGILGVALLYQTGQWLNHK